MSTFFRRRPWICAKCAFKQNLAGRRYSVSATATSKPSAADVRLPFASHTAPGSNHDDRILRDVFDSQPFWKDFSRHNGSQLATQGSGLFQNRHLIRPSGFNEFTDKTLRKAKNIVAKVIAASSIHDYQNIVKDLDRLSDLLCRVIDLSDFVRSTHPSHEMQAAANNAYGKMFQYMNILNTTSGLNEQLQTAAANPEVSACWSEEEKVVAQMLLRDFAKSAIDSNEQKKQKFIDMSDEISQWGTEFVDEMAPAKHYLSLDSHRLKGMDPMVVKQMTKWGTVHLPTVGSLATSALRTVQNEDTRKEIYIANRTASQDQIYRLEKMLRARGELAKLSGFASFAHLTLGEKMAKSPEAVNRFLTALHHDNQGLVSSELERMIRLKNSFSKNSQDNNFNIWDKDFYMDQLLAQARSKTRRLDFLPAYFSMGTVMQGLSRIFQRLYGIRLIPRETQPGETWNDDVRRLDVVDEDDGHIAVMYCDLFERQGKNPNPAHFTVRCSRHIPEEEVAESALEESLFASPEDAANDGMATVRDTNGKLYQVPTIALICDFARGPSNRPTLLSFREVQTLFHEMGHAVHSMLGRTDLQNVSGTRCATDFAELPSVLMENFASNPQALALFARHWETDAPLPFEMVKEKIDLNMRFEGIDTESQIILAKLDQAYHSAAALDAGFDTSSVYHSVYNNSSSLKEPPETKWQGFFGHLFGYGATYYSYLFDRAISGKIWREVFQKSTTGSISREAGTLFRSEVLKWGGGRDPWKCVAGVLKDPSLDEGGTRAMEEVGKWGVKGTS